MSSNHLTRRGFAAAVSAGAASIMLAQQRRQPRPEVPRFQGPLEFKRNIVPAKVQPFPLGQVKLLPSAYKDAREWNLAYMNRLDAGRLLHNFRQNAGLSSSVAKPFGGWEAPANGQRGTELRGHFTGHFLSGTALMYATTGDREVKAKGDLLVDELAKVQQKVGGGYLSAFPMELFDRLDSLAGRVTGPQQPGQPGLPWAPFYTIHKIMAGMLDLYQLAGNRQALQVLERMAEWADRWTASKSEEHMQQILTVEFGGMAETLYNLAAATGNDQWAKVGDRFTKKSFMNPLALRRDELNRGPNGFPLHVNTHIPQVIGAARRYDISGDMRFHDVADFFWYEVTNARCYVTGGTSNGESWPGQARELGGELKMNVSTAECCCAYNMMKLTRQLYGWTGDPRYFDYYERTLLNHRIGTILPGKGYTQYYLSLYPGAWKTFNNEDANFWCCTGTGVEEFSKLNDSIYWRDDDGVYVNLFVPSELNWPEKAFALRQDTKFPEQPNTTLTVTAARGAAMPLRLRIPAWLDSAPTVKINGRALEASANPGSYLSLMRVWNKGDRIEMALPMRLRMEPMPDEPQTQAALYGPLVLAGDLGAEGLTENLTIGMNVPGVRRAVLPPVEIPTFQANGSDPNSWIKPTDKALTFRTAGQQKNLTLLPLNSIFGRRYVVYLTVA